TPRHHPQLMPGDLAPAPRQCRMRPMVASCRCFTFAVAMALAAPAWANDKPPIVVELFTSQGCNSCPPADAFFAELAHRAGLLPLAFHVDYWNYIGWTDPFARPWATARQ